MVRAAVRPPEYFPRLAYCALFFRTDRFLVADTLPYSRQSPQNRARVRTPEQSGQRWQYLTAPIQRASADGAVRAVELEDWERWGEKHARALFYHYGTAPFYDHYAPGLRDLLHRDWSTLGALAGASVAWTHRALRAPCALDHASNLPGAPGEVTDLLDAIAADILVTLPESAAADRASARNRGVTVLSYDESSRRQNFDGFVPGLSALDLLMNYGPKAPRVLTGGIAAAV